MECVVCYGWVGIGSGRGRVGVGRVGKGRVDRVG